MKYLLALVILLSIPNFVYSQKIPIVTLQQLQCKIKVKNDTTYVVNFWATWCAPCVKELPCFDSITSLYKPFPVKVFLVSIDFKEDIETKLIPFLRKKKVQSEVLLLNETDANYFIPQIDTTWTGSIPATLIINTTKDMHRFFEKKISTKLLQTELEKILK